ncbi:MAG: hypothetical protein KME31_20440 [Tolypothrix carrinoi HA7290-LM1]|jgi:hypothetical protein|nr:hypothetical protein [Tolypothrix carrinoi HA7290-LM1]
MGAVTVRSAIALQSNISTKIMEPSQEIAFIEAAKVSKLAQATEQAAVELTEFIDFVQYHNPEVDRATATMTTAFCLHNLRTAFLEEPEMMQELSAIARSFSQG